MVKCSKCKNVAVVRLDYARADLCRNCFNEQFEKRVKKASRDFDLIKRGEKIVVGVSGGKDSQALLYVLDKLGKERGFKVIPLLIDEGIACYRPRAVKKAKALCKKLGLKLNVFSYKKLFGVSMDEVMKKRDARKLSEKACSFCGVFRKSALNIGARKLRGDKLAIGHNADDLAQTFLMNFLRNEPDRLKRFGATTGASEHGDFIPRIKPLLYNLEVECAYYCLLNDIPFYLGGCPYAVEAFRGDVKDFLTVLEDKHPGMKFNLVRSSIDLRKQLDEIPRKKLVEKPLECIQCGEPGSRKLCQACLFKKILGLTK